MKSEMELLNDATRQAFGAGLEWQNPTINSGAITVSVGTSCLLQVLPQGGVPDDLDTISAAGRDYGTLLILRGNNPAVPVTVTEADNINLTAGDFVLRGLSTYIALLYDDTDDHWRELFRVHNPLEPTSLVEFQQYWSLEPSVDVQPWDAQNAVKDAVGSWTAQQVQALSTLTWGAAVAWNLNTQQVAKLTLTGATAQLSNPSNPISGGHYTLEVIQDAAGGRALTFGTEYVFAGGTPPDLSAMGPNEKALLVGFWDGSKMLMSSAAPFI